MIKVIVATDFKMICKGKSIYIKDTTYNTIRKYKKAFGYVVLCTRNYPMDSVDGYVVANDIIDEVVELSNLSNTLIGKHDVAIKKSISNVDLVIARVPSIVSYRAVEIARMLDKPVFSVAIGCAWDAYWNHRFPGKLIAPYMYWKMKWCMKKSDFALYVTEDFLQKRYPSVCKSVGISDVVINNVDDRVLTKRKEKIHEMSYDKLTLMTSGSVGNKAKGQEYMIKAIPILNKLGIRIKYLLAGGESSTYLNSLAEKLHVSDQVEFLGMLSTEDVIKNLDRTDIYIQPSLQEGLPRAVVEAMSRGCPVIGANTGGIPELISKDCIVKRKSRKEIAEAIVRLLESNRIEEEAVKNYIKSKSYNDSFLSRKRNKYYEYIIDKLDNNICERN